MHTTMNLRRAGVRVAVACLLAVALWALTDVAAAAAAAAVPVPLPALGGVGPSVQDVVEFTKITRQHSLDVDDLRGRVSPNGRRAFVVTRQASVARDSNVYEFLLLDVRPDRLARGEPDRPRSIFKVEGATDNAYSRPFVQDAHWVDDATIVFRGRLAEAPYQVYTLNADSGQVTQRTFEHQGIASFAVAGDLSRVVYATWVPNPPLAPGQRSVVVGNRSFWSVKFGQDNIRSQQRQYQYRVIDLGASGPGRALGGVVPEIGGVMPPISVAPDGRWALIPRHEAGRQVAWAASYPLVGEVASKYGPASTVDPLGYYTRPQQWLARRNVAYRLSDGAEQPLLDAPDDATPLAPGRVDRLWQGSGQSVIVGGTHLPLGADTAAHVIEYWPDSGRYTDVAVLERRLESVQTLGGGRDGFVVVLEGGQRRAFVKNAAGAWQENQAAAEAWRAAGQGGEALTEGWRLRTDQALDRPADIVAVGPQGQAVRLTALNPQFSTARWGTIKPVSWQNDEGLRWDGLLMVPGDYDPTRRYPLVIQTYGFEPTRFYLDGMNLADGATSGFAGRAFLRENILVLALPLRAKGGSFPEWGRMHAQVAANARAAIAAMVARGIADPDRIGLMGWSATGEQVLNLLTFHDVPVRAASNLDGDSNSLFMLTVASGYSDTLYSRMEATNHGTPFGKGLAPWVANDPSLHTDCIRAALRIESYGPTVTGHWDIHTLLRRQYKPVEMIVIPGGTHSLAQPSERMISLQGNVDWYRFWLKGEERHEVLLLTETAESLRDQYVRWRQMAELKRAADAKPRCSTTAVPRG